MSAGVSCRIKKESILFYWGAGLIRKRFVAFRYHGSIKNEMKSSDHRLDFRVHRESFSVSSTNLLIMNPTVRAYIDLTRLQFFFAWPLLFCSGYLLATTVYGNFSWFDLARVSLIGFFGFEAGLVLNDYIDREYDKKDVETDKLTKYWRIFKTRPIPAGLISPNQALGLFIGLAAVTTCLILTLPYPHSLLVLLIMIYSYTIEMFYQMEKRQTQKFPFAQLIGRTDFALFPVPVIYAWVTLT